MKKRRLLLRKTIDEKCAFLWVELPDGSAVGFSGKRGPRVYDAVRAQMMFEDTLDSHYEDWEVVEW